MNEGFHRDILVKKKEKHKEVTSVVNHLLKDDETRYGLVIGIQDYANDQLNLRYAVNDAQSIYELMVDKKCGMFERKNVNLLLNNDATKQNIWRALSKLKRKVTHSDTVWIYYAGHAAAEDDDMYWVTHDANINDLFGTALGNNEISKVLQKIVPQRLFMFLDCCHAAAMSAKTNLTRSSLNLQDLFASYQGYGRVTIASSDGNQTSLELADHGHGAFTYHLVEGMRGKADIDENGIVTADELWKYLKDKVNKSSQKAGYSQTPILQGEMSHDIPLTLNPVAVGKNKRISDKIIESVKYGGLTQAEADFCIEIIRSGAKTDDEKMLFDEFESYADIKTSLKTLKKLVKMAREKAQQTNFIPLTEKNVKHAALSHENRQQIRLSETIHQYHEVPISPFYVDAYPILQKDFNEFRNSGFYDDKLEDQKVDIQQIIWTKAGMAWLRERNYNKSLAFSRGFTSFATGISWYEAIAFCNWRTFKNMRKELNLANFAYEYDGNVNRTIGYRLPTEAELEVTIQTCGNVLITPRDAVEFVTDGWVPDDYRFAPKFEHDPVISPKNLPYRPLVSIHTVPIQRSRIAPAEISQRVIFRCLSPRI